MDKIIVHCSATKPSMDIGVDEIRKWHLDRGWSDVGYNYVIKRDGVIQGGRDLDGDGDVEDETGAHARGFNRGSLGICLVGGIDENGKSDANFTLHQYQALSYLWRKLKAKYKGVELMGHRDLPGVSKDCPCFDVVELLEGGNE